MFVPRGVLSALLVVALLAPVAMAAQAESIPHEQFDKAKLDLAVLKLLLNESLRLATESIWSCVAEDSAGALAYSDILDRSLAAPARIIENLSQEVDSYSFLSFFIPPFQDLSAADGEVTRMFAELMANLTALRAIVSPVPVPPEVYETAMAFLATVNSFVYQLLAQLDVLEDDATTIGALPEIPDQGTFDVTPLLEAIEALRNKLRLVEAEMEIIASRLLDPVPKLFLKANSNQLYLGQTLILTGYLLHMGTFVKNQNIVIDRQGQQFASVNTGSSGKFAVSSYIPIDPAQLGTYQFQATTVFNATTYTSPPISITVSMIPTSTTLYFEPSYELGKTMFLEGTLRDYQGVPLAGQPVSLSIDSSNYPKTTDQAGRFNESVNTTDLGLGTHSIRASYAGNSTHAPSSTPLYTFAIKYPAILTLELSSTRLKLGQTLTLSGMFTNITLEPIAGAEIRIILDSTYLASVTTGSDGSYSFTIDTDDIGSGTHVVYAEHDGPTAIWYYTKSPNRYFEVEVKKKPGLLPDIIAGTGKIIGDLKDILKEIFTGKMAPFAWALLIILVIVAYLYYKRIREKRRLRRRQHEERQKALEYEPKIVPMVARPLAKHGPGQRGLVKSTLASLMDSLLGSLPPKEAIIFGYARFLQFLGAERNTPIDPSLTHIEIQSELSFMGYPKESLTTVTRTYEKAMYTVREVSVEEALGFADALSDIEGYGVVRPA